MTSSAAISGLLSMRSAATDAPLIAIIRQGLSEPTGTDGQPLDEQPQVVQKLGRNQSPHFGRTNPNLEPGPEVGYLRRCEGPP